MKLDLRQQAKLKKIHNVVKNGNLGIIAHLFELEDKLEKEIPSILDVISRVKGEKGEQGIQGEKGETGDIGLQGIQGERGIDGKNGKDGRDGLDGRDGADGKDGKDGKDGRDGRDGVDGKDATIDEKKIKDTLDPIIKGVHERVGRAIEGMPRGSNWGGFIETQLKDATTGLYLKKDSTGAWLVTANGGSGGSGAILLTTTSPINDSNTTFAFTNPQGVATLPTLLVINKVMYRQTGGAYTWTVSGNSIILSSIVGINGSILGIFGGIISSTPTAVSNVTTSYTFYTQPIYVIMNGPAYLPTGGTITWSYSGTTLTVSSPPGSSGSIFGLSGIVLTVDSTGLITGFS